MGRGSNKTWVQIFKWFILNSSIKSETLIDPSNAPNQISPKPTGVTEIER